MTPTRVGAPGADRGSWPYVLSVGTFEPRKNLRRLVAAFELLAEHDRDLRLVLVGGDGWQRRGLDRDIARSPFGKRVICVDYLEERVLAPLIAGAEAMAYVSLYEGFGLPVVEARALGTPVVTSNRSSLPEAAGGEGVLVDPYDIRSIAAGIERARVTTTDRSPRLSRTWADVARDTRAVYESAANERHRP